jgi:hypothetical protein
VRRIGMVLAALTAMLALTTGSALALVIPGTLDQQQTDTTSGLYLGSNFYRAQTFTAGATGTLDAVTIHTGSQAPSLVAPAAAGDYSVEIWATSAGVPSGASALAAETVAGDPGGAVVVIFTSPASVVSGTQYAIRLVPDAGGAISWLGNCETDNYAGGQALIYDVLNYPTWRTVPAWAADADSSACLLDFAFATYVTAPQATAQPTAAVTPPPTATKTGATPDNQSGAPVLLVFAGLASAAAFVTIRRYGLFRG